MRTYETHVAETSEYFIYTPSKLAQTLFFHPVITGHFIYEPGYSLKRNSFDSFLVMLITEGKCTITTKDGTFTAKTGDAVLLNCYEPHQYESKTGWESCWLHFDGPLCQGYYDHITELHSNVMVPRNSRSVELNLNRICDIFRNGDRIVEPSISKYITEILTELMLSKTEKKTLSKKEQTLAETISYINEHFAEELPIEELAERTSLSPFYFSRRFAKETGMTPHQYIIATRINAAKFLLTTTNLPIKQVALKCGFTSESSFCTTFRKWENIKPGDYRVLK